MNILDTLIKRCLTSCVKYPKIPKTKGDILRYALYVYLKGEHYGLCHAIINATEHYHYKRNFTAYNIRKIPDVFPLFCYEIAVEKFNASGQKNWFWWPTEDWKSRYKYMKWLIEQYMDIEL